MKKTTIVLCLLGLFAFGAQAEVYKWLDADGKIQYGDTPPKDVKASKVSGGVTVMPAFTPPPAAPSPEAAKAASKAVGPAAGGITTKPEQESASSAAPVSDVEAARLRMIEACKRNRGVDCEDNVDAQLYGQGGSSTVYVPVPGWSQPPIRPTPKPPAQSSSSSKTAKMAKEPAKKSNSTKADGL
ncbi:MULTISPECIES: DUF4124 domain-containing protein [unclassified Uliginosibacterium]|uniref:DUF4124 domain-containing protein n=1 Tax=unclassified Uliginosibacterium TaxID=2621521 RepID=UPI000C7DADF7|nr:MULTISPECIES: DUF4124 domain-containing protein [unclassified Uliginosibacterium]MDO6385156.1 DUF4124 domain-containing protein [Uliginosibacterium sp. 31-12]PLK48831.1 hypothetical protein C0V76_12350 [Uliginosibacterium sp. TH139]